MPKRLSPWSACIGACTGGTWSLVWAWVFVLGVWGPCYAKMEMVRATVQALAAVESRLAGYPGAEVAADYVERELAAAGIRNVRREEFEVVVPVDEGGYLTLEASGERFEIWGLWPNLVRTASVPPEGVRAPMIYGGLGAWRDFNGSVLDGRMVLMEFDSWNHWLRAASLGARAIVFIEPDGLTRHQAEAKYAQVPLDIPRFWISHEAGARLRQVLQEGEALAHLASSMRWQRRPAWNIWGVIEGNHPELSKERVVIEAYYDGISVVPALAPSAETACSVAALLEVARNFRENPPARTVILAATSAHFLGRQGIVDFLDRHARRHPHYASKIKEPLAIDLFIGLDLSSRTDQVGLWSNTDRLELRRFFAPFGRRFTGYADSLDMGTEEQPSGRLVNGITPVKGMDWSTYMPGGIAANSQTAFDAGLVSLGLVTVNDGRFSVDSPLDRAAGVQYENLERQIRIINGVLNKALADPALLENKADFGPVLKDKLRDLRIKVRAYPRRSQVPDKPVGNSVLALRSLRDRSNAVKGVRTTQVYLSDARGELKIAGLQLGHYATGAYALDPQSGAITYATDLGKRAEGFHGKGLANGMVSTAVQWQEAKKFIVVFPCVSQPFYGLVNPRLLSFLGGVTILSKDDTAMSHFGFALGGGVQEAAGVVFAPVSDEPKNQVKILVGGQMLLLNNGAAGSEPDGIGFALTRERLIPTVLQATEDMWRLDESRLQVMRNHAIESPYLQRLHQRVFDLLEVAKAAAQRQDWEGYAGNIRVAMGLEAQVYPQVVATLNDVIKGVVFFLALLIPAAFLAERLIFSAVQITRQLAGFGALLAVIWLAVSQVHPAFSIAHPLVVLMAFVIMAMACFVLLLIISRFNRYMKERGDQVHNIDVGRLSVGYAAFMLGISNMRRRKLRTGLTLSTLVLLTFTVLSFSSFETRARFISVPLQHEGAYEGVLVRDRSWYPLGQPMLEHVASHFVPEGTVSPRNWYILKEDKKTQLELTSEHQQAKAYALLGLSPQEQAITGVGRSLLAGRFFGPEDKAVCLVPERMARSLGIRPQDLGQVYVQVLGQRLTVQGIVDAEVLNDIRDLDDGSLMPVDFEMSNPGDDVFQGQADGTEMESQYRPYVHLAPDNVLIVPYETLRQMGGVLRSVAIRFSKVDRQADGRQALLEDFMQRVAVNLFVGLPGDEAGSIEVAALSSVGATAIEGLGVLMIPMLIAALIVLNTMLGAVYERLNDIGIFSSVGLAPSHIALLFMAEACAYAILGITLGYLGGQGLGLVLNRFDLLTGLNLNYSSLAAVSSALIVMGVVLLSAYYPARVAARSAVPDVVRRWQPEPPVGAEWEFRFPLLVSAADVKGLCVFLKDYLDSYSEASIGNFYTEGSVLQAFDTTAGPAYALETKVWLAPLDLGVSQHMVLCARPEATKRIYALVFYLRCLSGDNDSWQRTNKGFIKAIRKELLIWNTLKAPQRAAYLDQADEVMLEA